MPCSRPRAVATYAVSLCHHSARSKGMPVRKAQALLRVAKVQARAVKPLARLPATQWLRAQSSALCRAAGTVARLASGVCRCWAAAIERRYPLTCLLVAVEVQRREAPRHHQQRSSEQGLSEGEEAPGQAPLQRVPAQPAHAVVPARHIAAGQLAAAWCVRAGSDARSGQLCAVFARQPHTGTRRREAQTSAAGTSAGRPSPMHTGRGAVASRSTGFHEASKPAPVRATSSRSAERMEKVPGS